MQKSKITIEFTPGISQAYPSKLAFLRDYLPTVCAERGNGYSMASLARDLDLSPSKLAHKLAGNGGSAWSSKNEDKLKQVLSATEYLPIIAYDIESTQRQYCEIEALKARLSELGANQ